MGLLQINGEDFEEKVMAAKGPILLDLWADWCAPCHALMPTVERLAKAYGTALTVAQMDMDANKPFWDRLAVRGIPTLLLFRDGGEVARITGVHPYGKLVAWLDANGVTPAAGRPQPVQQDGEWCAFHGDAELKRFFLDRVSAHAEAGEITNARMSYWGPKGGTISSAFMRQAKPSVFERATGLPISLGLAMEFAGVTTAEQVGRVLDAIPLGADLADVARRLMLAWLGDPAALSPAYLDDPRLDAIRMDWARHLRAALAGETVAPAVWVELRQRAANLRKEMPRDRSVPRHVAAMLADLSPPPQPDNGGEWAGILLLLGKYTISTRLLFEAGYSHYHLSLEDVRYQFCEKVANGRDPTPEVIAEIHQKWESEHADDENLIREMQAYRHANGAAEDDHLPQMLIAAIEDTVSP
ncbi:thioredoxin family protein [Nitrospirillum viridazoti]|uniref:Thioredoxin n=1 Tax=Nitrospirillum amazonense TaxID=28077 RepID=A0A560IZT5_9PROT|nr:thioredoxin domain-containing protein [Nitrospirillum amazonense]TWB63689.1 thioredoxin [Nitrospirillum amazonense]